MSWGISEDSNCESVDDFQLSNGVQHNLLPVLRWNLDFENSIGAQTCEDQRNGDHLRGDVLTVKEMTHFTSQNCVSRNAYLRDSTHEIVQDWLPGFYAMQHSLNGETATNALFCVCLNERASMFVRSRKESHTWLNQVMILSILLRCDSLEPITRDFPWVLRWFSEKVS